MERNKIIECCAQIAHEANRIYCEAHGDMSQVPWKDAKDWQKKSAIDGIYVALNGATPKGQHDAWYADKIRNGWKYGPVKDADKKEHPCLVPYEDLPPEQQRKDSLYIAVVNAMGKALTCD